VKKRWKGLCALWIVLALVIGAFPVAGAVEDAPESAAAAVSEDAEDDGRQIPAESGRMENSSEESPEISSSETEDTELAEEESTGSSVENFVEREGTEGSSEEKEGAAVDSAENSEEKEGTAVGSSEKEEAVESSEKGETWKAPGQSVESERTDEETASEKGEEEKESEKSEESNSVKETSVEGASAEESSMEKSASEGDSKKEILETTAPAFTVPELPEHMALSAKAAAAREAATSAEVWLYVGSDEISAGAMIYSGSNGNGEPGITIQFDKPLNDQSALDSITPPQDKKLSGWRLWGLSGSTESGNVGDSPLEELEITGQISADEYNRFIDSTSPGQFLLIEPLWRDARDIMDGDSLDMNIGDSCNLSEGTWKVSGDGTVYTVDTGGRTVYAARNGTFTFSNHSAP